MTEGLKVTHGLHKDYLGSNVPALLDKIKSFKFKDYFLDFDRLRKGVVTESRFVSGLGDANNEFTQVEADELIAKYRLGDGNVDYRKF